jgi:hypothetical protein
MTRRWAWSLLILTSLMLALLGVPPVRAQLLEFINLGAVRIFLGTSTNDAPPGRSTEAVAEGLSLPNLSGETTLQLAEEMAGFGLKHPSSLGAPDRVHFQEIGGPVVVMLWLTADYPERVRVSLTQLGSGAFAAKGTPGSITATTVRGSPALWLIGTHSLFLVDGEMELVRLVVEGNVLVWEEQGITYRLESSLDLESARDMAETLR